MKKLALVFLTMLQAGFLSAQLGGQRTFEFLNLPIGSRVSGLGGVIISATSDDVNMFLSNPSLLDTAVDNYVSWSFLPFYADVKFNTLAYAKNFKKIGMLGFGIQHLNYGTIEGFDLAGNPVGTFDANETAITVSHSHQLGPFRLGVNLKFAHSKIYTFGSSALLLDLGGSFIHPEQELVVSLLFKNFGFLLSDYSATARSSLPTDVQLGVTFKPKYMPFRFTFTAYNLNKSNATYFDTEQSNPDDQPGTFDKIFRHINIGTEIVLSKNVNVRFGYNHLIRKELRLENRAGATGLSFGLMARIKAFELSYTLATYHVDGGRSHFTITSDLNKIFNKKSII